MVSQNESWTSYDSRVESRVEAVRTGPGTCLIGKESIMYSKNRRKKTVHNTTPPLGRCSHTPFKQGCYSLTRGHRCPGPSRPPPFQGWQRGRQGCGSGGPTGHGSGTMSNECVVPHTSHSHGCACSSNICGGIHRSGLRICCT